MKNADKYSKVGTLSLHLQKYQIGPEKEGDRQAEQSSKVEQQEIKLPTIKVQINESPKYNKGRASSRDRHQEKSSTLKLAEKIPIGDLEDEQELLLKCQNLTSRVELLKREKYQQAIQEFQEEERKKLEFLFEKQKKIVAEKNNQKRNQIKLIHQRESVRIAKGLEDTKKYKEAYNKILEDLVEKKEKLEREYEHSIQQVIQAKEKLVSEWKRSSNEDIIKKCSTLLK